MKISADLTKDVATIGVYHQTDIACIGLWNSDKLSWVNPNIENTSLTNFIENGDPKTDGQIIATKTGSDGNFKVILHLNENLSTEESSLIYKQEKGISLSVNGQVCIGSPEWAGGSESSAIERNKVDVLLVPEGEYIVDAYSLLIADESGGPKYIQFVFCIFTKEKYVSINSEIKSTNRVLSLQYTK